jgi:3',5'-cyclic AMP phosphodiesterase CpdA
MRVAVVSDVHFGDDLCTLVATGPDGEPSLGPAYAALRRIVGHVDYLILLGDILDFSVASYQEAYRAARAFFVQAQEDLLAREYVYVPGNHDFDIWHTVEHQVNVINQLKARASSSPTATTSRPSGPRPRSGRSSWPTRTSRSTAGPFPRRPPSSSATPTSRSDGGPTSSWTPWTAGRCASATPAASS